MLNAGYFLQVPIELSKALDSTAKRVIIKSVETEIAGEIDHLLKQKFDFIFIYFYNSNHTITV